MKNFNNADPKHVLVNPKRARKDKPHLWFEDGFWRVSPYVDGYRAGVPHARRWSDAHKAISDFERRSK